jgi:hypothetical protein
MAYFQFQWTDDIASHLLEHDVSRDDFESVVNAPVRRAESRSTGRPCCWGETVDGRYLLCVYECLDALTVIPITAYEVPRPGRKPPR